MIRFIHLLSAGLLAVLALGACPAHAATVPAIGCPADGQMGAEAAPKNGTKSLTLDADAASGLAYFQNSHIGVLGPRGWHCLVLAGSNGVTIFVTPERLRANAMLRAPKQEFSGNVIQLSVNFGETSGRFEAARLMARVFPQKRKFVEDVIAEKILPASDFVFGPYPHDRMVRRSATLVEYETRENTKGLGTDTRLAANSSPISGMIFLSHNDDVSHLAVRITDPHLTATIIRLTEIGWGAP